MRQKARAPDLSSRHRTTQIRVTSQAFPEYKPRVWRSSGFRGLACSRVLGFRDLLSLRAWDFGGFGCPGTELAASTHVRQKASKRGAVSCSSEEPELC